MSKYQIKEDFLEFDVEKLLFVDIQFLEANDIVRLTPDSSMFVSSNLHDMYRLTINLNAGIVDAQMKGFSDEFMSIKSRDKAAKITLQEIQIMNNTD